MTRIEIAMGENRSYYVAWFVRCVVNSEIPTDMLTKEMLHKVNNKVFNTRGVTKHTLTDAINENLELLGIKRSVIRIGGE